MIGANVIVDYVYEDGELEEVVSYHNLRQTRT